MIDDTESDFCDRLPGQHTGRLSLELQAREAAEWQRKVDDLQKQLDSANQIIQIKNETIILWEKRCDDLREELDDRADTIAVLHKTILEKNEAIRNARSTSPAAVESAAAEESDVKGRPLPLCPKCKGEPRLRSETRSGPKSDCHWIQCSACGNRTIVRPSWILAIQEWKRISHPAAGESAPISPEVPQAHWLTTPATPSAAVGSSGAGAGDTIPPEVGKRYVCRNGEVTDAMTDDGGPAYPFVTRVHGIHRSWQGDGRHDLSRLSEYDLIAEYHETEPSPKSASHHVCFYCQPGGNQTPDNPRRTDFCWRCGHRGEGIRRDEQKPSPPSQQAESPDDWVPLTDPDHVARPGIDECVHELSPLYADVSTYCFSGRKIGLWFVGGWKFRCRRKDLPVVPEDPNAERKRKASETPCARCGKPIGNPVFTVCDECWPLTGAAADKPSMRQVTLRELRGGAEHTDWTTNTIVPESSLTGRTAVVEVPE